MLPKRLAQFLNCRYNHVSFWKKCMMRWPAIVLKYSSLLPVPLSIITLFLLLMAMEWSLFDHFLFLWSVCEIGFFLSWKKKMQGRLIRKPYAVDLVKRGAMVKHCLTHAGDVQELFSRWMLEQPNEPLHLEYSKPFINDMFFDKVPETMTPEEMVVAKEVYQIFHEHFSPNLKPNAPLENFRFMSPATDFFPRYPKPIITSLAIFTLGSLAYSILHSLGFRQHVTRRLSYWFLPGDSSEPPIMYIHGIGIGYTMYLPKIYSVLPAHPGRAVILLDLPHISMLPTDLILDHDETLQALDAMFLRHNLEKVTLVTHSYGTIVASWIIQHRTQYLSKSLLVDPVCFMMVDPMLTYSFLYTKPKCILHEMSRFFFSTDPLISLALTKKMTGTNLSSTPSISPSPQQSSYPEMIG
ncbi:hypothetical protein DSO57_1003063 [Entomophthora muscae]|uniref:Uncharacterized protein n=1 Tax=Entomophthora muscae TaxID=34485 RepID=A0ACC2TJ80_9FUNG|nr:hypothetical protein DSO57_1003063 [Entomophthora muscae]